jgi:hypothetical protein
MSELDGDSRSGVRVTGFDELRRNTLHLADEVMNQAIMAAQDEAARIMKGAIEQAAPIGTRDTPRGKIGPIRRHIIVYESKDRRALFQAQARRRLLVGPSKREAFYAYFIEHGWVTRKGTKTPGVRRHVPGRPWMRPACDSSEGEAYEAGKKVFEDYVSRETQRMR